MKRRKFLKCSATAGWWFCLPILSPVACRREKDPIKNLVKAACKSYVEGFMSPTTDLMYGKRINGSQGIAVLESPGDIGKEFFNGEYKPYGYGAGIEDVAYHNGILLLSLCEAYQATNDPYFEEMARRIFKGMKRIGTLSPVPGFVPRGPHPDGKSYYRDSSIDQHSLFVCGLWRYFRSPIASSEDKMFIINALGRVAQRLERNKWVIMVEDDSRQAHAGAGDLLLMKPYQSLALLSMLAAVADVTGDEYWWTQYEKFSNEAKGERWKQIDRQPDNSTLYTMFNNQEAFWAFTLAAIEKTLERKDIAKRFMTIRAGDMLTSNFFTRWRRLDWLGYDYEKRTDEEVNALLKPLGLTINSRATVMNLWNKYNINLDSPELINARLFDLICVCTPVMVGQIALLSGDTDLCGQIRPFTSEIFRRIDFNRINGGWIYNYIVVIGLLDLVAKTRNKFE